MESARQNILTPEGQTGLTLECQDNGGIFINYHNGIPNDAGIALKNLTDSMYIHIYPSGNTVVGNNILAGNGLFIIGTQTNNDIVFIANSVEQFRVKASGGISFTGGLTLTSNIITTGYIQSNTVKDKDGVQILDKQQNAVASVTGGATIDAEARTAINSLLLRLRTHGLIAT